VITVGENKTLIIYATRGGATEEVTFKIAEVLRQKYGFDVDVVNLRKNSSPDISPYRNVIVGSGVRAQRVYKEAVNFLERNDFGGKNVALFILCLEAGNPKSYNGAVKKYIKRLLEKFPHVKPVATEAFGGRIKFLGFTIAHACDFGKVKAWAESLGEKLLGEKKP
jgi:menaquinone-dependent protoporphyrinogen IX oxidase